ncbi:hypothetical protein VTI74DRAFT_2281 [Chaetomium olivicolor]
MMRRSSQNYVCWRCLCLRPAERALVLRRSPAAAAAFSALATSSSSWPPSSPSSPSSSSSSPLARTLLARHDRAQLRALSANAAQASQTATELDLDWGNRPRTLRSDAEESHIRDMLRKWEAENPAPALRVPTDEPTDGVANTITKNRSEFGFRLDVDAQGDEASRTDFDGVDGVDLGVDGALLQAGDLVEVSSGAWKLRILAICLGNFNGHLHFYTITGKWFTTRHIRSGFVVRNFVQDPGELEAVIEALPSLSPSSTVLDELQDLNVGPSRDLASSLIRKMYNFQSGARSIHQTYVERLSRAHLQLGDKERILSLREIAEALLPSNLKRNKRTFPAEALYAVYSVIEEEDIAFRALDRGARQNESYLFVLRPTELQENVHHVEQLVRDHYDWIGRKVRQDPDSARRPDTVLEEFLEQARPVIDQARQDRDWSPYGMLGPYKGRPQRSKVDMPVWSDTSIAVLRFMEHWATAGFRTGSRFHWIGASVLRALGRYDGAFLDSTTGWTFLQEIGWIPPWDVSARHSLRLPGIRCDRHAGLLPPPVADSSPSPLVPDQLADLRQEFARSTVYCIDSADTLDVDDGISLEAADNGEYWIHIHVADPASRILPDSSLAQQAAVRAQTNYLAGFNQRMLDGDDVREAFSLGPNRPTLTFSARVTETGHLVDTKITPGVLRDVLYITPEDVSSVVGDVDESVPPDFLEVGTRPEPCPVRRMTKANELSRRQRSDLQMLSKLAAALQQIRLQNGAMPAYMPKVKAKVSLDGVSTTAINDGSVFYHGDPFIRVQYEGQGNPLVSSLMQLAGEVGARWCYERDIPVPYRVQILAGQNERALRDFTRDVFYPQLLGGKAPRPEDWATLRALLGGFDISTFPAPNYIMGLDIYTKVTSPLRRYPDLLVHWQIEAALLEEHRTGNSLVVRQFHRSTIRQAVPKKQVPRHFLPFSKQQLEDSVFPHLRIRERHARLIDNVEGNKQWILQALVRAWRFGEDQQGSLPKTFRLTVNDVVGRRAVSGTLDWFEMPAVLKLEDLNDVVRIADVKPGEVYEVELADVNVHVGKIYVRMLRRAEEA